MNKVNLARLEDLQNDFSIKIAASDASDESKAVAKYICDGINDEEQFNLALADLPNGGCIELSEGTFKISENLTITTDDILIKGQGMSTVIYDTIPRFISISSNKNVCITHCRLTDIVINNYGNLELSYCKVFKISNYGSGTLKAFNISVSDFESAGNVQISNSNITGYIDNYTTSGTLLISNNVINELYTTANIIPPTTADIQKVNKVNTIEFM